MRLDFIKWELIGLCKLAGMCQNRVVEREESICFLQWKVILKNSKIITF